MARIAGFQVAPLAIIHDPEFKILPSVVRQEHVSPLSRRFHAQPNDCPSRGPHVFLCDADALSVKTPDSIREAARQLKEGLIVAIKGLDGFHLAVDGTMENAVKRLKACKQREEISQALMSGDLQSISDYARACDETQKILWSEQRPIVLLTQKHPNLIVQLG